MHLLITTYKYLIAFNLVKNKWDVVHKGDGIYYGIAKYNDLIIVGKRNNPNKTAEDMANYSGSFIILNNNLKIVDEIKPIFPIRDLHGINVFDNKLWATCSFDNIVSYIKLNSYPLIPLIKKINLYILKNISNSEIQIKLIRHLLEFNKNI